MRRKREEDDAKPEGFAPKRARTRSYVKAASSFFRLPREVRDMIYGYVLTTDNTTTGVSTSLAAVTVTDSRVDLGLLLTNKIINREGEEYIAAHAPFNLSVKEDFHNKQLSCREAKRLRTAHHLVMDYHAYLIRLDNNEEVRFHSPHFDQIVKDIERRNDILSFCFRGRPSQSYHTSSVFNYWGPAVIKTLSSLQGIKAANKVELQWLSDPNGTGDFQEFRPTDLEGYRAEVARLEKLILK